MALSGLSPSNTKSSESSKTKKALTLLMPVEQINKSYFSIMMLNNTEQDNQIYMQQQTTIYYLKV
jgi:hypothetical protein